MGQANSGRASMETKGHYERLAGGGGRGVTFLFGLDGCAAEQGMAFRFLSVKQVTQFRYLASSDRKPLKGLRMSGPHLRQQQFFFLKSVVHDI